MDSVSVGHEMRTLISYLCFNDNSSTHIYSNTLLFRSCICCPSHHEMASVSDVEDGRTLECTKICQQVPRRNIGRGCGIRKKECLVVRKAGKNSEVGVTEIP